MIEFFDYIVIIIYFLVPPFLLFHIIFVGSVDGRVGGRSRGWCEKMVDPEKGVKHNHGAKRIIGID